MTLKWDELLLIANHNLHQPKKSSKTRFCDFVYQSNTIDELIDKLPSKKGSRQVSLSLQLDKPILELLATAIKRGVFGDLQGSGPSFVISNIIVSYLTLLNNGGLLPEGEINELNSDRSIITQGNVELSEEGLLDTVVSNGDGGNTTTSELNPVGSGVSLS